MNKKEQKKSLKEKFAEHHNCYKKYHKETTNAVFIVGLLIIGFFAFIQSLPTLTGFAVATGETAVDGASNTVTIVNEINQSENRMHFKLFMYTIWIMLFGLISVAVIGQKRKKGKL